TKEQKIQFIDLKFPILVEQCTGEQKLAMFQKFQDTWYDLAIKRFEGQQEFYETHTGEASEKVAESLIPIDEARVSLYEGLDKAWNNRDYHCYQGLLFSLIHMEVLDDADLPRSDLANVAFRNYNDQANVTYNEETHVFNVKFCTKKK